MVPLLDRWFDRQYANAYERFLTRALDKSELIEIGLSGEMSHAWRFNDFVREGYKLNPVIYACLNKIAEGCASLTLRLAEPDSELVDGAIIPPDQLNPNQLTLTNLLKRPNRDQSMDSYTRKWAIQYDLAGATFQRGLNVKVDRAIGGGPRIGTALELRLLNPGYMRVQHNHDEILGYEFKSSWRTEQLTPAEIIYVRHEHPSEEFVGMSPLESCVYAISIGNLGQIWNHGLLKNDARPAAILVAKGARVNKESEREALRKKVEDKITGAKNAGRVAVIQSESADLKVLGLSPKEMDWTGGDMAQLRKICAVLNVPSQLVGDTSASTFANVEAAEGWFYTNCVLPRMKHFANELQFKLRQWYQDGDITLTLDTSDVPALQDNSADQAKELAMSDWLTVNEIRELRGREPLPRPDLDLTYIEIATAALRSAAQGEVEEPEPVEEIDEPDVNLEDDAEDRARRNLPAFHPQSRFPTLEARAKEIDRREKARRKYEPLYHARLLEYWKGQQARVINAAVRSKRAAFNEKVELEEFIDVFETFFREMLSGLAIASMEDLLGESLKSAGVILDQSRPAFNKFLTRTLTERSRLINETTAGMIKDLLETASGQPEFEIKQAIQGLYEGMTEHRAEAIVRTEVGRADIQATREGYEQITAQTGQKILQEWLTARDANVRDEHVEMDGRLANEDGVWSDPPYGFSTTGPLMDGPASFNVNCRCLTAGLLEGESKI